MIDGGAGGGARTDHVGDAQLRPPQLRSTNASMPAASAATITMAAVRLTGRASTFVTAIGGVSFWASVLVLRSDDDGACWILRTTSMPETTRPNAAKPWPSGLRWPPKSSDGWSLMQMNQPEVALSAVPRAIDTAPSTCFNPVTLVRSSGIGGKPDLRPCRLTPA